MKITKEDFNKLEILDRIEFRQKFSLIRELYLAFTWMAFLLIITNHSILGWIFLFIAVILLIKSKKKVNKLEEEYFNIQKVKRNERGKN